MFIDGHGPPGKNTGVSIQAERHPKRPPPLFKLYSILGAGNNWISFMNRVQIMQLHHLRKPDGPASREPGFREVHLLDFVCGYEDPRLAMREGTRGLAQGFLHFIELGVSSGALVEAILLGLVFVGHRRRKRPKDVAQALGDQVLVGQEVRPLDHRKRRVGACEKQIIPESNVSKEA